MPWKVSGVVDERKVFVERYRDGESMTALCREAGISRKTGYKFVERYERLGEAGLLDSSRRPRRVAKQTPEAVVDRIVELRMKRSTWGPRKLRAALLAEAPEVRWPSQATFAAILKRKQLSKPQRRRRLIPASGRPPQQARASNDVWCIDYKGQFKLGNGSYCYPFTVTDEYSRYVLACEAFASIRGMDVKRVLSDLFRKHGLPKAIRSDNGAPFASSRSRFGWSSFTPWLMQLNIEHERIEPGHPEQNGRHERMHRTLKAETTRPAERGLLAQQTRFDSFRETFNFERPHEALGDVTPASVYEPSRAPCPKQLPELSYPLHDLERRVLAGGIVRLRGRHRFGLSCSLIGQVIGLRETEPGRWLVTFARTNLGIYSEAEWRFLYAEDELQRKEATPRKRRPSKRN